MKASELLKLLVACDPDAVVIFGEEGKFTGFVKPVKAVRQSNAEERVREGYGARYLEMPQTGKTKVVVLT